MREKAYLSRGDLPPEVGSEELVGLGDLRKKKVTRRSKQVQEEKMVKEEKRTATKVAFKKLPVVAVDPLDWV